MMMMQPRYLTACVALPALLDALQVFYLGKDCKLVHLHMKGNLDVADCQEVSHYQFNCSENQTQCGETQEGFWLLPWPRVDPSCLQRDAGRSPFALLAATHLANDDQGLVQMAGGHGAAVCWWPS